MDSFASLFKAYTAAQRSHRVRDEETRFLRAKIEMLLPGDRPYYQEQLKNLLAIDPTITFIESSEALAYEIERAIEIKGQFELNPAASFAVNWRAWTTPDTAGLTYTAYGKDGQEPREYPILLQSDVPLFENGQRAIYETKFFPTLPYGMKICSLKQILKYQAAINHSVISRAVVEVRGRIHRPFLEWMWGHGGVSPVPDVQVICAVPLPSGQTFRFNLKPPKTGEPFPIHNPRQIDCGYSRLVVSGLWRRRKLKDRSALSGLLSGVHVDGLDAQHPCRRIKSARNYRDLRYKLLHGFWSKAAGPH